jgi:hypothetical protein
MPQIITKALPDGHTITVGGRVTMGQFRAWARAEQEGQFEAVYKHLAAVVQGWDYDAGDPRQPESYDNLTFTEYRQVNEAVVGWLRSEVEAKN